MLQTIFLCAVGLLLLLTGSVAQPNQSRLDSVEHLLHKGSEDTTTALRCIYIGQQWEMWQPDSAAFYYRLAGDVSRRIHYPLGIIKYINNYSDVLNMQGRFAEALLLNQEAVAISRENHLLRPLGICLRNVADAHASLGNNILACACYLQALPFLEQAGDSANISILYSRLSRCYLSLKLYDSAATVGARGLRFATEDWTTASALNSTGMANFYLHRQTAAVTQLQKALQLGRGLADNMLVTQSMLSMAMVLRQQGKSDSAKNLLEQALAMAGQLKDNQHTSAICRLLGEIAYDNGRTGLAQSFFKKALAVAIQNHASRDLEQVYSDLAFSTTALGQTRLGKYYDSLHQHINDSLFGVQVAANFQELNIKYQAEKKQAEIERLRIQKAVLTAILVMALMVVVLLYWVVKSRRKEQESEKRLSAAAAIMQGQEQERERLARDLHDGLGGMLTGIQLSLSSLSGDALPEPSQRDLFNKTLQQLHGTMAELRRVAHNLIPEAMVRLGLVQAVQDYCKNMALGENCQIRCVVYGLESALPGNTDIVVYRIVQELVNNICKHAAATEALVQLMRTGNVMNITVEDNGKGFDTAAVIHQKGDGLRNVQSRVAYLKGMMNISANAKGTSIYIEYMIEP